MLLVSLAMLQKFYRNHSVIGTILRIIKFVTTFIIVSSVIGIGSVAGAYFYFAHDLPNIQTLKDYKPPVVSEVFDENENKIGEFWTECRFWVPIEAIPKQVLNSFISAEDARFYEHRGIDMFGIGRAFLENLKAGHVVQGGSTITQQITRSLLLSNERKVARKVREAILATRIERNLNKEQILELYLNQIFLGNRAYGIKAAARNYFNKSINDLTLAETAMIAGMPTAPSTDSPVYSIENAKARQSYVLSKMYEHGFITKENMTAALNEPLTVYAAGTDKEYNGKYAPYFTEHVRRMVLEKYGEKVLYEGGLKIYTTANLNLNIAGQMAVRKGLEALDKRQGYRGIIDHTDDPTNYASKVQVEIEKDIHKESIHIPPATEKTPPLSLDKFYKAVISGFEGNDIVVLVGKTSGIISHDGYKWARTFNTNSAGYDDASYLNDPRSKFKVGDIVLVKKSEQDGEFILSQKPLIQGALYSMEPKTGEVKAIIGGYDFSDSEFNRATQALRQPGSSFKPFIYAAALDKGFKFGTEILDAPIVYQVGAYQKPWAPKNYGGKYSGITTFESDLIHSRNIPTVKIANDVGLHYVTAYIRKLGLTTEIGKFLSMALGSNGVYLSEMVTAYSTFASYGIKPTPIYIRKITDKDGNILEDNSVAQPVEARADELSEELVGKMKDLNTDLFTKEQKYIKDDGLVLSQEELKILYGEAIPPGYAITPQTAYLMTTLLQGVVERGTGTRVRELKRPAAGKTGTTNDETDCWFIGYVPNLTAGVWVGFDNIEKIGSLETGGKTAAPIFLTYMKEATKNTEVAKFTPPDGIRQDRVTSLAGGSAIYFKGYSLLREGIEGEHRITDRAIDFFEEDIGDPSEKPAGPAQQQQGSDLAAEPFKKAPADDSDLDYEY